MTVLSWRISRRRAVGNDAALMHGRDAVGEAHHDAHVVLDDQQRDAALLGGRSRRGDRGVGFRLAHARDGLVEQQQAGADGQRSRHVDALLDAERQLGRQLVLEFAQVQGIQQRQGLFARRGLLASRRREAKGGAKGAVGLVAVEAGQHVLEHGLLAKELDVLEGPPDAEPADHIRLEPGDVMAVEQDTPGGRLHHAGNGVDEGRLAGAVGADQAADLAGLDVERQLGDGGDTTEADRHASELEQAHGHTFTRDQSRLASVSHKPLSPRGMNSSVPRRIAP